jgi:glycosyltransferase involved in cell wall biosynthesis
MSTGTSNSFGVVVIGRNEGERLKQCLGSLPASARIVYVDSGSTDGSVEWARARGVDVVELDLTIAFTAARARNTGFAKLKQLAPQLRYVQFVDGDCELAPDWPAQAIVFLDAHDKTAAVFGRRRERFPERSIYNLFCDHEWNTPLGETKSCGGDVMMRVAALAGTSGYRVDMIAGEEPELCVRLRVAGWSIQRIDQEMTMHDAAITKYWQWWRRHIRSGYAFAHGAHLHGSPPERMWVWESRRAWVWGSVIPLLCVLAVFILGPAGLAA